MVGSRFKPVFGGFKTRLKIIKFGHRFNKSREVDEPRSTGAASSLVVVLLLLIKLVSEAEFNEFEPRH